MIHNSQVSQYKFGIMCVHNPRYRTNDTQPPWSNRVPRHGLFVHMPCVIICQFALRYRVVNCQRPIVYSILSYTHFASRTCCCLMMWCANYRICQPQDDGNSCMQSSRHNVLLGASHTTWVQRLRGCFYATVPRTA